MKFNTNKIDSVDMNGINISGKNYSYKKNISYEDRIDTFYILTSENLTENQLNEALHELFDEMFDSLIKNQYE